MIEFYYAQMDYLGIISDERIREVLHHIDDNTEVLNTLIADVYDAGAGDNVTIIVGTI